MNKKYVIRLTDEERNGCHAIVKKLKGSSEKVRRAQILLKVDANFCYTPKHGSWLNVAECELSCMTKQCLSDRRIAEVPELQSEIGIWSERTNVKQRAVDWQFRIDDARVKIKRLYPKIKV